MGISRNVIAVAGAAFLFTPAVLYVVGVKPTEVENRRLAEFPTVSQGWDALDGLGPWATDHLAGREYGLRMKSRLDRFGELGSTASTTVAAAGGEGERPANAGPMVVDGKNGVLFYARDFEFACGLGEEFSPRLQRLLDVAELLEASGRRALVTVAPNKSSVQLEDVPGVVPRGECATEALRKQEQVLDGVREPLFLPLRADLRQAFEAGDKVYWDTDTHWTTVGAAHLAQQVASRWGDELPQPLPFKESEVARVGDLTTMTGGNGKETAPALAPSWATARMDDAGTSWTSSSEGPTLVPGRTLLLGDSFLEHAVPVLAPIFAEGSYLKSNRTDVDPAEVVQAIVDSDVVVLGVVQRELGISILASDDFYDRLKAAL